jgi:hypothetical protein
MTERQIQSIVGVLFILSHIAVIALVGALYIIQGFTFEEMTTTISIMAPVFAGYTLIITRAIVAERSDALTARRAAKQSGLFIFLSLFMPVSFVAALVAIILLRAYNIGIGSFEQFKAMLAIIEGIFAVYLGPIVQSLFSAGSSSDGSADQS